MRVVFSLIFAISFAYGALSNAAVYFALARRGVPMSFTALWVPGHLYLVCASARSFVGPTLRRFALSTNIALVIAIVAFLGLISFGHP